MSLIKENSINKQGQKPDAMKLVATGIVNARFVILAAFVLISVYCALSIGKVNVNEDLTAFLPDTTETRKGLTVMEDEFMTYGSADVMISNITVDIAQKLADEIYSAFGTALREQTKTISSADLLALCKSIDRLRQILEKL